MNALLALTGDMDKTEHLYFGEVGRLTVSEMLSENVNLARALDNNRKSTLHAPSAPEADDVLHRLGNANESSKLSLPIRHIRSGGACWFRWDPTRATAK